jgi:fluoride ion exporter CrcB/FEX
MLQYLWIGLGGFIGANTRYLLQQQGLVGQGGILQALGPSSSSEKSTS